MNFILNVQNNTSVLKKKGNPDRKIARIGRGKHQKAFKQEIRRVHNSNPLQRHNEHVYSSADNKLLVKLIVN